MAANVITGLVPTIYEALDLVSREQVGFIQAVARDANASRANLGQVIRSPVTPAITGVNVTPANVSPDAAGLTIGSVDISITKSRAFPFNFNGEETLGLSDSPTVAPYGSTKRDLIAQAVRAAVNEVENDLAALVRQASRAYGTAGTVPFATAADMTDFAQTLKILQDNGCPQTELQMVFNTTTSAQLRGKQSQLFKVNESGTDQLLRMGNLGSLMRFNCSESNGLTTFTKGTGSAYTSTAAGFAVGTTSIPLITGSGTVLAGDVVTFAGDTNKYIVKTGVAGPGTIVLQEPGLRQALPASATALTIGNNYTPNAAFHRGAFQLVARAPALPEGGDSAVDRMMIVDPYSGLPLEFSVYKQYRQVRWEVALAWGVAAVAPRHSAMLLS